MNVLSRARHLALALAVACAACTPASRSTSDTTAARPVAPPDSEAGYPLLDLAFEKPAVVGAAVRASVGGLQPGKTVELTWGTVSGGWVIEDYYHFRGKKYVESTTSLGTFVVDASGRLDARWA